MLILTRKEGEGIYFANNIKITILDISSNTVKIAFDCPLSINILREEVYEKIREHNILAQNMNIKDYKGVNRLWKNTQI